MAKIFKGKGRYFGVRFAAATLALALFVSPGAARNDPTFDFGTADKPLKRALIGASLLLTNDFGKKPDPLDLFTAAREDYGRLISALYANGYYGPEIHILIDGREAAEIPATDAPETIGSIKLSVKPGPRFRFSRTEITPLAAGTELPAEFRVGKPAFATAMTDAANAGIEGWRQEGHAKARLSSQSIVADHASQQIAADLRLDAGPKLRFGQLIVKGNGRLRQERLRKIAGFPSGEVYDPDELEKVVDRLRRTGVFRRIALTEAERIRDENLLDVTLDLQEEALRRYGFGLQVTSGDGTDLSAFWLHRNLFGGGERLRIDGTLFSLGKRSGALSYDLGARIDRPATPITDSSAFAEAHLSRLNLLGLRLSESSFALGLTRTFSDSFSAEAALEFSYQTLRGGGFNADFTSLALPVKAKWDRRDDILLPSRGS
ncbi:MAG: POTRA domain-containing protein, partial [Paracoccaceae bacterium]